MRCVHLLSLLATTAGVHRTWFHKPPSITRLAWTYPIQDTVDALVASPSRGEVYAGSHDGNVYAINAASGDLPGSHARGPVRSLAMDARGMFLYAGSDDGVSRLDLTRPPSNVTDGSLMWSLAASPSGNTVYARSNGNNVCASQASDGHLLWNFTAGGYVSSVAASPRDDRVYVGSYDKNVYALRASDGQHIWNFTVGANVSSVAVSPLGDTVYAGSHESKVYALRASDGHLNWTFPAVAVVASVAVNPSRDTIYAGADKVYALRALDGKNKVWNTTADVGGCTSVAVSPSGETVYAGSKDNKVYAFRASDGHRLWKFPAGASVYSVAASPSTETVYAGSLDNHVYGLQASHGQQLWNFTAGKNEYFMARSPSGDILHVGADNMLLASKSDGLVPYVGAGPVVDALTLGDQNDNLYAGYSDGAIHAFFLDRISWSLRRGGYLDSLAVHPEGDSVYAGVDRGFCKLELKLSSNMERQEFWTFRADAAVTSVASSLSDNTVYAVSEDRNVYALRASDGQKFWSFTMGAAVWSVAVSPSGDSVYAGSDDKNVYALRASDGRLLWNFTAGGYVSSVATSPLGDTVYVGSEDKTVYALQASDGQQLWRFTAGDAVTSVAVSSLGDSVSAGSYDDNVYTLRASDGHQLWNFMAGAAVTSLAVGLSGETVYAGSDDQNVYALRASDGRLLWKFTSGGSVSSVATSPSGDTVYAGSQQDNQVYAFRALDLYELWRFTAGDAVRSVAVSPSGDTVYAVSEDNNVYALRALDGQRIWSFTAGDVVTSVVTSPSGDTVYAVSKDNNVYALSECLFYTRSRVTSMVLSPSGDVVYAGSADHRVYAFNASGQDQLWNFSARGGVTSVALSHLSNTVYASSYDHNLYAIDAFNGSMKWYYKMDSVIRRMAVSPDGEFIYAGSDNFSILALYANKEHKTKEVDWERLFLCAGTATGGLAILLGLGVPQICRQSHVVPFLFAGAAYGSALGMVTSYVMVKLPRQVSARRPLFAEDHDISHWFLQDPRCYGLSIVISGLVMAVVWGVMAHYHRLRSLAQLCSALLLVSTIVVACNLVPGLWLAFSSDSSVYLGSQPSALGTWSVCSYFAGLVCLVFGLAVLDVLFKALERGRRTWRGHIYTRGLVLWSAFHWGFFGFWVPTNTALLCFGQHGKFVPPCSPLSVLGVAAGLLAFGIQLWSSPTDEHEWARDRASELASYVTWWPWARDAILHREWNNRMADIHPELSLHKVAQLCLNAWCPAWSGLRPRLSTWTGLQLTSVQGCQPTLKDELTWSFLSFTATSLLAVMPLVLYWFYARFVVEPPQTMSLTI